MNPCPCSCNSSSLESILDGCKFDIKQIQKLIFQKVSGNYIDLDLLSTWQDLVNGVPTINQIAIITPFIGGEPTITAGESKSEGGGDNSTKNGIEIIKGSNPSTFFCKFKSLTPEQELKFKQLQCIKKLSVYFVNENGNLFCDESTDINNATNGKGFEIFGFHFSDRNNNGFGAKDFFTLKFQLKPCWSSNLKMIKPEFNPLTEFPTPQNNFQFNNDEIFEFNNDEIFELN